MKFFIVLTFFFISLSTIASLTLNDVCTQGLDAVCKKLFPSTLFDQIKGATIAKDGQKYQYSYNNKYSLATFINSFPTSLKSLATKLQLDTISFEKTQFILQASSSKYGGKFSTQMSLFNVQNVQIDLMYSPATSFLTSLNIPLTAINQVVQKFVNNAVINDAFNTFTGSNFYIVLANSDFKDLTGFKPTYLDTLEISEGTLALKATMILNANCNNNLRKFLTDKFGPSVSLELFSKITLTELKTSVALKNIPFTPKLLLSNVELFFQITYSAAQNAQVGIKGTLQYTRDAGDELKFTGVIKFSAIGIDLAFIMEGIYRNAFGFSRFHFGNIALGMGISYQGPPTNLLLGGEVAIGKECYDVKMNFIGNDYCIKASGKVNVGIKDPLDNWFTLSFSRLNSNSLLRAIAGEKGSDTGKISRFLSELMSVDKLECAFAMKDAKAEGVDLKQGLKFSGEVTVFAVKVALVLAVEPKEGTFESTLDFITPVAFKNVVGLYDYVKDNKGPKFSVALKKGTSGKEVSLKVNARLKVLGIFLGVDLTTNKEELSFKVSGGLFGGKFLAEFSADTSIDSLKKGEFKVKGSIKLDTTFFKELFSKISQQIDRVVYKMIKKIDQQKYKQLLQKRYFQKILNQQGSIFDKIGDFCEVSWKFVCSTIKNILDLQETLIVGILDGISNLASDPVILKSIGFDSTLDDKAAAKAASNVLDLTFSANINNKDVSFNGAPTLTDNGESLSQIIFDKSIEIIKQQGKARVLRVLFGLRNVDMN